jgi:hypothetical protein
MTENARVDLAGAGSVEVLAQQVGRTVQAIGPLMFKHYRDAVGRVFGRHRREWLARTLARFRSRGIRVGPIGSGAQPATGAEAQRRFFYRVDPAAKELPAGADAGAALKALGGEAYSGSPVAEGLEKGGTFRARGGAWMAIPIGVTLDKLGRPIPRWATPQAFARSSPGKQLVALRLGEGPPKLYQVVSGRTKKAKTVSGALTLVGDRPQGRGLARALLPAYQLVRSITRRPLLRFYATWDELQTDRDSVFAQAQDRLVKELEDG